MTIQRKTERSWLTHERAGRRWLLICAVVALAGCSSSSSVQTERSAPEASVRVHLFDVYSGLALANAAVEVTSDDGIIGIVCAKAPCTNNGRTWLGLSDDSGMLLIPRPAIQFDTYVKTKDHRAVRLTDDAIKHASSTYQVELYPEWLYSEQYEWTRGYKLVDARTGKVLANTPVWIEFPANDWPAQHGGISSRKVKTNPLGYVFFSFLRKPEQKQVQALPSAPEADWVTPVAWVAVSGYGKAKLNYFEGSDAERFTTRLQRQ